MTPELLAAAFLLQQMHGTAFAAHLLEEHGMSRDHALRTLADRPLELSLKDRLNAMSHAG